MLIDERAVDVLFFLDDMRDIERANESFLL